MPLTRNNGSSILKNALPTRFGNLSHAKDVFKRKKLKRLLRKSGFAKRCGHPLEGIIEAIVLAVCTGSQGTLAASDQIKDPAIACKASRATLNRAYSYATDENVKHAMRSLLPGFRKRKGNVWIVDGTFIHVHGDGFELAKLGHDSMEGKINCGYLLLNVFDMATKKPIYWLLVPGNTSEMKLFSQVLTDAMGISGENPGIVVFDRGYLSHDNLNFLKREGISWVTQAEANMKVSSKNRYLTPRNWFEYYETGKSREVYWKGYGAMLMAKDEEICNGKLISWRVIIGSPELTPRQIILLYNKRWAIEEYHKQLRALGLNVLPTGKFDGLKLHVLFVVLAYLLLHALERALHCIGKSVVTIMRGLCVAGLVRAPS
jgi:hypothetical protein